MSKKVTFSLFHRKFENGSFLAKNGTKLAFLAQNAQKWRFFLVSRQSRWTFGFTSVRSFVPIFLKIRTLEFSDFLY